MVRFLMPVALILRTASPTPQTLNPKPQKALNPKPPKPVRAPGVFGVRASCVVFVL